MCVYDLVHDHTKLWSQSDQNLMRKYNFQQYITDTIVTLA